MDSLGRIGGKFAAPDQFFSALRFCPPFRRESFWPRARTPAAPNLPRNVSIAGLTNANTIPNGQARTRHSCGMTRLRVITNRISPSPPSRFWKRRDFTSRSPQKRKCCGRPAFSQGNLDEAGKLGQHNLAILANDDAPIIFLEPSCYSMFAEDYRELKLPGAEADRRSAVFCSRNSWKIC